MIFWRSTSKGTQLPSWVQGCDRVKVWGGNGSERIVAVGAQPWHQPPPAEVEWRDCGEDWQAVVWGDWSLDGLLREQMRLDVAPAEDGQGRAWRAPMVLHAYPLEHIAFDLPLGRDWKPEPTTEQELLINVAQWARSEILQGIERAWPDEQQDYWKEFDLSLPHERCAMAVSDLLCAVYHLNDGTLQACRLLDQRLILTTLQAAAGMPSQSIEKVRDHANE